jgi:hypothetical protein
MSIEVPVMSDEVLSVPLKATTAHSFWGATWLDRPDFTWFDMPACQLTSQHASECLFAQGLSDSRLLTSIAARIAAPSPGWRNCTSRNLPEL